MIAYCNLLWVVRHLKGKKAFKGRLVKKEVGEYQGYALETSAWPSVCRNVNAGY